MRFLLAENIPAGGIILFWLLAKILAFGEDILTNKKPF